MAILIYHTIKAVVRYRLYLPQSKETYYCNSAAYNGGWLRLRGVYRYKHDSVDRKIEKVYDFDLAGVHVVRTKVPEDINFN